MRQPGNVDEGTAQTDWLEVEKRRGISVKTACARLEYGGGVVQLIDTPGHVDFAGEVERSLAALDGAVLVLSAVASIRIDFVAAYWLPLLLLVLSGTLWNVFMVLYFAPKLFKVAWFERAIAEFGQAMGVTATGLLLLRTVDPENKTCAASAFGYKQLFHEPFMGGGIITSLALPLVMVKGGLLFWIISMAGVIFWLLLWFFVLRGRTE